MMERTIVKNRWFVPIQSHSSARLRLFCFPYAGGSASIYRAWAGRLPPDIEVTAVQLPGREDRLMEPPVGRVSELVQIVSEEIRPYLDKPFAFWGHSMGALLAFELARQLRRAGLPQPCHLLASGRQAPQLPGTGSTVHRLPEKLFITELRRLEGTPEAVLQHEELMSLLLPALRADFEIVETYAYEAEAPLDCPVTAFGGLQDRDIREVDLQAWHKQTTTRFSLHTFPDGHFFLHSNQDQVLQVVSQIFAKDYINVV